MQSGSGMIYGTCEVVDCIGPLTDEDFLKHARKLGATRAEVLSWDPVEEDLFAWVLTSVKRLDKPVRYTHPRGAVIWVALNPRLRRKLELI